MKSSSNKPIHRKLANAHPEEAYSFFSANDCFVVFENELPGGYRASLLAGE